MFDIIYSERGCGREVFESVYHTPIHSRVSGTVRQRGAQGERVPEEHPAPTLCQIGASSQDDQEGDHGLLLDSDP